MKGWIDNCGGTFHCEAILLNIFIVLPDGEIGVFLGVEVYVNAVSTASRESITLFTL
jgi:ferredoxin